MQWLWLAVLMSGVLGCAGTSGRVAPIEDGRHIEKPITVASPARPVAPATRPDPPVRRVSPDAQVFALPDDAAPTPAAVPDEAEPGAGPAVPPSPPADPVTAELLAQASRALARGDRGSARSTLERAIKLKPRDPAAWVELAELNHAEGEFEQALVVAQRARNLAGDDPAYLARIELVVARARARLAR